MFTILRSSITMEITLDGLRGPRDVYNPEVINHNGDHVGWSERPSRCLPS